MFNAAMIKSSLELLVHLTVDDFWWTNIVLALLCSFNSLYDLILMSIDRQIEG